MNRFALPLLVVVLAFVFWLKHNSQFNTVPEPSPSPLPSVQPTPVASAAAPTPIPTFTVRAVPPLSHQPNRDEFVEFARKTLEALPNPDDLKNLTDEQAHFTPQTVIEAGRAIGRVAQAVKDHPEFSPEAGRFYHQCASTPTKLAAVRALCFSNLRNLHQQNPQIHFDPESKDYEDSIRKLSESVP